MIPAPLVAPVHVRSLVLYAATLAGTVMGMVALASTVPLPVRAWLPASLITGLMVGGTMRLGTRGPANVADTGGRLIFWSWVMGMLNVPLCYVGTWLVGAAPSRALLDVPLVALMGAPIGLVLGFAFGVVLLVPALALALLRRNPTPAAADGTVAVVGLWMLAIGVGTPLVGPRGHGVLTRVPVGTVLALLLAGAGLVLSIAAVRRWQRRIRFVQRAARGLEAGWAVEPREVDDALATLPRLGGRARERSQVLVRRERPGHDAYRRAATSWPVAWVPPAWL